MSFLLYEIPMFYLTTIFKYFASIFGDYIPLKLCWTTEDGYWNIIFSAIEQ